MKQNNKIDRLITKTFELEGLLTVLRDRQGNPPANLLALIAEKATELQTDVMMLAYTGAEPESTTEPETDSEAIAEAAEMEREEDSEPCAPAPAAPAAAAVETVDHRLARQRAKEFSKAFTLNDKYRFCRELFHGSEADFNETLDIVAAMTSPDEAVEYFYDDLCWDPDNEYVKEFMTIVERHF